MNKQQINSVWHEATEMPQFVGLLLVEKTDGSVFLCKAYDGRTNEDWRRWAYVSDLLPDNI